VLLIGIVLRQVKPETLGSPLLGGATMYRFLGHGRGRIAALVLVAGSAIGACAVRGQVPDDDPTSVLRADLRRLAFAQKEYFGAYRRYDTSPERIGFQPSQSVLLDLVADSAGWMAVATRLDDAAQCVLWYGLLSTATARPENRVGETAMGTVACFPESLAQLERDLTIANLLTMSASPPWGGWATTLLLKAAESSSRDVASDSISQWFAAAQAYETDWAAVSDHERILQRALASGQGAPWQSLLDAVVEANIYLRAAEQDLIRSIGEFDASPALARYRSGAGTLSVSSDDLRRDAVLTQSVGRLDAAWHTWRTQFFVRSQAVDRFLRR
jgi:hypothetical protein